MNNRLKLLRTAKLSALAIVAAMMFLGLPGRLFARPLCDEPWAEEGSCCSPSFAGDMSFCCPPLPPPFDFEGEEFDPLTDNGEDCFCGHPQRPTFTSREEEFGPFNAGNGFQCGLPLPPPPFDAEEELLHILFDPDWGDEAWLASGDGWDGYPPPICSPPMSREP